MPPDLVVELVEVVEPRDVDVVGEVELVGKEVQLVQLGDEFIVLPHVEQVCQVVMQPLEVERRVGLDHAGLLAK